MKMRTVLGLVAAIALVFPIATATTFGQISGMGGSNRCFGRLYSDLPDAARITLIGSSRVRRAVLPERIAQAVHLPDTGVINLAHPTSSLPLDWSLMNRLSRDASLDIMVFGVLPRSAPLREIERAIDPRPSEPFDFAFAGGSLKQTYLFGAPYRDQLRLIWGQTDTPLIAAWDSARLYAERMRQFIPAVLTEFVLVRLIVLRKGYDPARKQDCLLTKWEDPAPEAQFGRPKDIAKRDAYAAQLTGWVDPDPLGFFSDPAFALDRAVIRDQIALARARGAQPVFLYLPSIHVPVDPRLSQTFRDRFGAALLVPDDALRAALAPQFTDNSHVNSAGRRLVSDWLAAQLGPMMTKGQP